jgi:hypothetical protein
VLGRVRAPASRLLVGLGLLTLVAGCGGSKPVAMAELPVYPGAMELKPGETRVGDTLASNAKMDAAIRSAVGAGGSTEQKGFSLPRGTRGDQVQQFYADKLKAGGWESGAGGPAGGIVANVLGAVNQGNDLVKTALWSRGTQTLTVLVVTIPGSKQPPELILSLASR